MDRYFRFLSNIVGGRDYSLLLKKLHRTEFYSLVPNDDNRGEDGRMLRDIFLEEREGHIGSSSLPDGPCTLLEMLVALAIRMEQDLEDNPDAKTDKECFWIMIANLDLIAYDNQGYYRDGAEQEIGEILQRFLDRTYHKNGVGGLFPLSRTKKDQRKVEIWYQKSEYLLENFDF